MERIFFSVIISSLFFNVSASAGDKSTFYVRCLGKCATENCTDDGLEYLHDILSYQSSLLRLLHWTCYDECGHECMWKTVNAFKKRNWKIPQFFGKWPFIRIFGIQEPASAIFSLMNIYSNYYMFRKFKKRVPATSPLYWLWHIYSAVCIHGWFWSMVFHSRDLPFTELMDYICAFSIILTSFYCMVIRLLYGIPSVSKFMKTVITSCHLVFFINHVSFLVQGIEYGYNMKVNVAVVSLNIIIWFAWCIWNRKQQPYTWQCAAFLTLNALATILEVFDFSPIFWMFDSHSLWHLSTALIAPFFYNFMIDDCRYLYKLQQISDLESLKVKQY